MNIYRLTNADLARAYRRFNRLYFGNRLPKDTVVRFSSCREGRREYLGFTMRCAKYRVIAGKSDAVAVGTTRFRIILNQRHRRRSIALPTLLHEMVHVENYEWYNHGKKFDARMLRLAEAGAFNGLW